MKKSLIILFSVSFLFSNLIAQTISTSGFTFSPDTLFVNIGDTINFNLSSNHNAVEVSENTWNTNGSTPNSGFNISAGGGSFIVDSIKTYYYVCQPHASMGMKGIIVSSQLPCNKNINQSLEGFNPDPVYGTWIWSYDTLSLTNTSNCDVRVRSEFTISHSDSIIGLTDFDLKCYNPYIGNWPAVPYSINSNGDAQGYFGFGGDTTGQVITQGTTQQLIVKIRFRPNANYGNYSSSWSSNEVDSAGNFLQTLELDSTHISYVDCSLFAADSTSSSDISCFNANDGSASIFSIQNGSNNYSYSWSNGDSTNNAISLSAGSYYCIVTDLNWQQCSDSVNFTISEPLELTSSYTQTNVSCFGADDGSTIVNFYGGTIGSAPNDTNYILGWAGTQLPFYLPYPQTVFNTNLLPAPYNAIPAGVYPYSVTDMNGCIIYDTITITQPDTLFSTVIRSNVACFGYNDGSINQTVNGGTAPFDYFLNGILQNNLTTINLSPGTYIDSIVDANGCVSSNTTLVTEPSELTTSTISNNISCFGECDGQIQAITSGGTAPYYYVWWYHNTSDSIVTNLCAGVEGYEVFDQNGCLTYTDIIITEPDLISLTIDTASNISTFGGNDGFIEVSANGGSGTLNFNWTNSSGFNQNTEDIYNLYSDFYFLEITDINSCVYLDTIELTQPTLWINLDQAVNANCFDSCNGSLSITANGGDSTYTYLWSGPNNFSSTNDDLTNLCYGEYILTISDSSQSLTDTFNIFQPQPLTYNLSVDSITCNNGVSQAQINVWGGTQPFIYTWLNGDTTFNTIVAAGTHSINVVDQNGCFLNENFSLSHPDSIFSSESSVNPLCYLANDGSGTINIINGGTAPYIFSINGGLNYQSSNSFNNLSSGNYTVQILDSNNCQNSVTFELTDPDELMTNLTATDVSCFDLCDAIVQVTASGGTPSYSYSWSSGQTSSIEDNLCAGSYSITVTDANGCLTTSTIVISQPNPIIVNITLNGTDLVATSGFTSYQWYNGDGTIILGENSAIFTPNSIGEYYVTVSDSLCTIDSYIYEYLISGISDLENHISIYPNPSYGEININHVNAFETITMISALGNELLKLDGRLFSNDKIKIDLSDFNKGIYFLQIKQNNHIMNYRIVLQ